MDPSVEFALAAGQRRWERHARHHRRRRSPRHCTTRLHATMEIVNVNHSGFRCRFRRNFHSKHTRAIIHLDRALHGDTPRLKCAQPTAT